MSNTAIRALLMAFIALVLGTPARAACTGSVGNVSINVGTIDQGTAHYGPVGSVFKTIEGTWDSYGGHAAGSCGAETLIDYLVPGSPTVGDSTVYATNLQGIGMRIWIWTAGQVPAGTGGGYYGTPTSPTVIPLQLPQQDLSAINAAYGTGYNRIRLELITTAPDWQSGVLQVTGPILSVSDHTGQSGSMIIANFSLSGTLNVHSCNVTTTKLIVDLGSVRMPDIVFDKPTAAKPFTIEMTCSSNPKVSVQFDGLTVVGNQKVLQLRNDPGSATGIGLQISDSTGNPVTIGQGTPLIDAAPNGINRFNFSARYVPIATHRTPGTADANATFTMEYN
ncbi:MAG: hypothetical protein JWR14_1482 [Caballeronia sp.]|uniref:fimbrial protein n=1 Tax=Caballeronia sp. TaxID=1931223 RepID=UPI002624B405|nr:fimbrial protein [Caballeronia sp.]MDB5831652.1 hypothetical protein [Caballeronia sp.]